MHLIVRRQACRSRSENLAIAQRCSSGTRTPRLTPRGSIAAPGSKSGWTVPPSSRSARPQGEMRPAPANGTTPPGVAVPSESPRPSFSLEPAARPALRHRNAPGIGLPGLPAQGTLRGVALDAGATSRRTRTDDSSWGTAAPAPRPSCRRPFFPFGVVPIPLRFRLGAWAQTLRRRALDPQPRACRRSR